MKRTFRLPLSLGLLVALSLGPLGCVRPKPNPTPQPSRISLAATATQTAGFLPSPTIEPGAEQTPVGPAEGEATPTPIEVEVITEPTAAPTEAAPAGGEGASTVSPTEAPAAATDLSYEVRWGDTLSAIARRFGTTVAAIQARNPVIANTNQINAGWILVIPTVQGAAGGATVARETGDYVIQYGDTLAIIARRFGVTIAALVQANPWITNRNYIPSGRHLVIPAGGEPAPAGRTHTVRYGDTLASIARTYGVSSWSIVVSNNLANPNLIYPGQVLIIP